MMTYNNIIDMLEHNFILNETFFISNDGFIFVADKFDGENCLSICGVKDADINDYDEDFILDIEEDNYNRMFNFYKPNHDIITYYYTPINLLENEK